MTQKLVRVWRTILINYYAEISNGLYGSHLVELEIDEDTRKLRSINKYYGHVDEDFIERATMIAETKISLKTTPNEYPWIEDERFAYAAIIKLFPDLKIPKRFKNIPKQPTGEIQYY